MKKKCPKCHTIKALGDFDQKKIYCKACRAKITSQWRKENLEKASEYKKNYEKNNPDKVRNWQKEYKKQHPEKVRKFQSDWNKNNPEKYLWNQCHKFIDDYINTLEVDEAIYTSIFESGRSKRGRGVKKFVQLFSSHFEIANPHMYGLNKRTIPYVVSTSISSLKKAIEEKDFSLGVPKRQEFE